MLDRNRQQHVQGPDQRCEYLRKAFPLLETLSFWKNLCSFEMKGGGERDRERWSNSTVSVLQGPSQRACQDHENRLAQTENVMSVSFIWSRDPTEWWYLVNHFGRRTGLNILKLCWWPKCGLTTKWLRNNCKLSFVAVLSLLDKITHLEYVCPVH